MKAGTFESLMNLQTRRIFLFDFWIIKQVQGSSLSVSLVEHENVKGVRIIEKKKTFFSNVWINKFLGICSIFLRSTGNGCF